MDIDIQAILCTKCLWRAMRASNLQCAFSECVFSETGAVEVVDGLSYESYTDRISGKKVLIQTNSYGNGTSGLTSTGVLFL